MARLELVGVSKTYRGGVAALTEVSLEVNAGELVCLVGPSGCGKSTVLSLVAGLDEPTRGEIRIDGEVVNGRSPRERDVAMVFQSYALYPHMEVRRNIAFPLEVAKLPRAEIDRRVAETAALLGLEPLLARRPRELSGGQRQRVALGRALVRRPRLFLFDEPLSNLDAALRAELRRELKKLHQRLGATFLYVTHDQAEAMTLADRVAVMRAGRIEQVGSPGDVYDRPANVFVAGFFGSPRINLLRPETLRVAVPATGTVDGATEALVGLRPEHVEVGLGAPPEGALEGRVWLVEPTGAEAWVTVEISGERVVGRADAAFRAPEGARAWIRFDPRRLHRLDTRCGGDDGDGSGTPAGDAPAAPPTLSGTQIS